MHWESARSCLTAAMLGTGLIAISGYAKARRGELRNFTGLDSPYERPIDPELVLDAVNKNAEDLAERILHLMQQRGLLSR